jgi:hypothetical protein
VLSIFFTMLLVVIGDVFPRIRAELPPRVLGTSLLRAGQSKDPPQPWRWSR